MKLYVGIDLHSNNNYQAIIDEQGERKFNRKIPNDPKLILESLEPFKNEITGVVIESTYNWYWIVDLLMAKGYKVHLANPSAIQQYKGFKSVNDKHDAFWLAEMLRLNILPEGYIYPKEDRSIRDLLRKRGHLVKLRTSMIISLKNIITRNCGVNISANDIKAVRKNHISPLLEENEDIALAGEASKKTIDFLTKEIKTIEDAVLRKVELREQYKFLTTIPGVGKIISLTIMLESGAVERFEHVGNYVSYCRKVPAKWFSNGKAKGNGNKKNGNKNLAWAFSEASEMARRFDEDARAYYNRKKQKTNFMVAHSALAHKLARAAYYIMRDQVPFDPKKLFA